jgi:dipeptidyl aminopeptidase B
MSTGFLAMNSISYSQRVFARYPPSPRRISADPSQNWRHSFFAKYYIYHIESKEAIPLISDDPDAEIDYAVWSPTQAKLAYVYRHNVYIRDMRGVVHQVTFDGGTDVFNGVPDWVFEEEVFSDRAGLWWSPDSSQIAYLRINESQVPVYSIPYYISNSYDPLSYPSFKDLKYPKAGFPNPVIDVYIYQIGDVAFKVMYPDPLENREDDGDEGFDFLERREGDETDGWGDKKLITNVLWMGADAVMLSETNRVSDHFRAILVDVPAKSAQIVRDEKVTEGWFEIVPSLSMLLQEFLD